MTEQEMLQEIERLRRELAETRKDRDYLHKLVCSTILVDPPEVMEEKIRAALQEPLHGIDDIIEDLLKREPEGEIPNNRIPA